MNSLKAKMQFVCVGIDKKCIDFAYSNSLRLCRAAYNTQWYKISSVCIWLHSSKQQHHHQHNDKNECAFEHLTYLIRKRFAFLFKFKPKYHAHKMSGVYDFSSMLTTSSSKASGTCIFLSQAHICCSTPEKKTTKHWHTYTHKHCVQQQEIAYWQHANIIYSIHFRESPSSDCSLVLLALENFSRAPLLHSVSIQHYARFYQCCISVPSSYLYICIVRYGADVFCVLIRK